MESRKDTKDGTEGNGKDTPMTHEQRTTAKARVTGYDGVYYWVGGSEVGEWKFTGCCVDEVEGMIGQLHQGGYHCVPGMLSIGAPEGPPIGAGTPYGVRKRSGGVQA
jgi:hypothetical protein